MIPMNSIAIIAGLAASYLLGAIPNGLLVARAKGVDIRTVGSGNIGATNVLRSVGKGPGLLALFLDALKGFLPAFAFPAVATAAGASPTAVPLGLLFGVAAIAGHNWPVYLRFKGGKGVATSAGVLIGIAPAAAGFGLLAWIVLFTLTRYVSVASIGAAATVAGAGWALYRHDGLALPVALTLLGALITWRHRTNIQRLRDGSENRFTRRKRRNGDTDCSVRH